MADASYDWSMFGESLNALSPTQKDLLISTIGNAGAALQAGQPVGQAMIAPGLQHMATKNKMNALLKLLKDYDGAKATIGGGKPGELGDVKISLPGSALADEAGMAPGEKSGLRAEPFSQMTSIGDTFSNFQTGSSSGDVGSLVGLTPADVSDMFQIKIAQDELKRRSWADIVDAQYKELLMEKAIVDMAGDAKQFTVPGTDIKLTGKEYVDWLKASRNDREGVLGAYDEIVKQAKLSGQKPPTFQAFWNSYQDKDSAAWNNYERAKKEGFTGSFMDYQKELAIASSGSPEAMKYFAEKETLKDKIEQDTYFGSPKFEKDVDEELEKNFIYKMDIQSSDPKDKARALEEKRKLMDKKIRSGYSRYKNAKIKFMVDEDTGKHYWIIQQGKRSEIIRSWEE